MSKQIVLYTVAASHHGALTVAHWCYTAQHEVFKTGIPADLHKHSASTPNDKEVERLNFVCHQCEHRMTHAFAELYSCMDLPNGFERRGKV